MPTITLTSVSLSATPISRPVVNIKYRKTSDPDIAGSYTNVGDFEVNTNGTFVTPVVISSLDPETQYTVWVTQVCSNSSVTANFTTSNITPCGTPTPYTGGEAFPTTIVVSLGPTTGTVTLTYDAFSIPDKFIVTYDGVDVIDTGYRGDSSSQSDLDAALAARGLPPETIAGTGSGTQSFSKTTATTTATVKVYAPLSGTSWTFTLSCPVP